MITVKQLLEVLLELDQQVVSPRPSIWGKAAELVRTMAWYCDDRMDPEEIGDWRSVDLSQILKAFPPPLHQPTIDELTRDDVLGGPPR